MKRRLESMTNGQGGLGWPGAAGCLLLAAAGAFYLGAVLPQDTRLQQLREQQRERREAASRPAPEPPLAPAQKLAAFYGSFPAPGALPDQLNLIYRAAQQQALALEQGEYRAGKESLEELMRYQITLPVRGTYPQIRKFVDGALARVPALALESIQFERQKIGEPSLEARIRFVLYLGKRA
jgi:hypothetical protein